MNKSWEYDEYGIKCLSLDEELALPEPVRRTRHNKIKMVADLKIAKQLIDGFFNIIRMTPEANDPKHADLVQEVADEVAKVRRACYKMSVSPYEVGK